MNPKLKILSFFAGGLSVERLAEEDYAWLTDQYQNLRGNVLAKVGSANLKMWLKIRVSTYSAWDTASIYWIIENAYSNQIATVRAAITESDFRPEQEQLILENFIVAILADLHCLASLKLDIKAKYRLTKEIQEGGYLKYYSLVVMTLFDLS